MRSWAGAVLAVGAIAALAYACIPVPDHMETSDDAPDSADDIDADDSIDGSDGTDASDADDMAPSDAPTTGQTSLFYESGTVGVSVGAMETGPASFPVRVYDEHEDFDGQIFTAPRTGQYVVCSSVWRDDAGDFALDLTVSDGVMTTQRRVAHGHGAAEPTDPPAPTAVSGCGLLALSVGNRVLVEIANTTTTPAHFGARALSSWIAISEIQNDGSWTAAAGLVTAPIEDDAPVQLEPVTPNWSSTLNGYPATEGVQLVCGALTYSGITDLQIGVTASPLPLLDDAPEQSFASGCRMVSVSQADNLITMRTAPGTGLDAASGDEATNWMSIHRLPRAATDWRLTTLQSAPVPTLQINESATMSFTRNGSSNPSANTGSRFGPVEGGGAAITCAGLRVQSQVALDVVFGRGTSIKRHELGRGDTYVHGCAPISLDAMDTIHIEVRAVVPAPTGVAVDPDAHWWVARLH